MRIMLPAIVTMQCFFHNRVEAMKERRGQGAIEYVGLAVLAAAIVYFIFAQTNAPQKVGDVFQKAIDKLNQIGGG
jgi:hypothetical protein